MLQRERGQESRTEREREGGGENSCDAKLAKTEREMEREDRCTCIA